MGTGARWLYLLSYSVSPAKDKSEDRKPFNERRAGVAYIDRCDWSRCIECGRCLMQCPVLEMDKPAAVAAIRKLIAGAP